MTPDKSIVVTPKYTLSFPNWQAVADIFEGQWICRVPLPGLKTGGMDLFNPDADSRPRMLQEYVGSLKGLRILELGPMEANHTYQLELLGADQIIAIEANRLHYLKCLAVKEMLGLKAQFLLGDFSKYLSETKDRFDIVFASGVLYHMVDPLGLCRNIAARSPVAFFWTHYVSDAVADELGAITAVDGYSARYFRFDYFPHFDLSEYTFTGGGVEHCNRLKKHDILNCLEHYGYSNVRVLLDQPDHPGGPAFNVVCSR